MSKKKNDIEEFSDMFADLKKSSEELESLLTQAKVEVKEEEKVVVPVIAAPEGKPNIAFGMHKNLETKKWEIAEIHYNPVTKDCIVYNECALASTSKDVAILQANNFFARVAHGLPLEHNRKYNRGK